MSNWRWTRFHSRNARTPVQKDNDSSIPVRLDNLIQRTDVTERDRAFFISLREGWNKYQSLTNGQSAALKKSEERYSQEAQQKRNEWIANFTPQMRERMKLCAAYYSKTSYFTDLARTILNDENFIPSEKQYNALCLNKYASRLVQQTIAGPKFSIGDIVQLRRYKENGFDGFDHSVMTVVSINDSITAASANVGKRFVYNCVRFSDGTDFNCYESELKVYRTPKENK